MTDPTDARQPSLPCDVAERIDEACDRFEGDWQNGLEPRIEDCLREWQEPGRATLLHQLLLLEIDYRSRTKKTPTPEEYQSRFPEYPEVVERVFQETGAANALADTLPATELATGDPAKRPTSEEFVPDGSKFGRFELLALLGKGAFGSVYRAHDPLLDRDVALKIPHASAFTEAEDVERFLREARSAAQLRHSNIVPVHETGEIDNSRYIVSDVIDGETLRGHLERVPKPTHAEAATLVAKLARALHYAHEKGVIHRDIKPENIMLDCDGEPLITDFGLAHREHDEVLRTREGTRMGTPAYMCPEQARGQSHLVDGRSDLWSLGVMLYELLAGTRPFTGQQTDVLVAILEADPEWPRKHDKSIPRDLETICLKCLAKDPDERYSSCQHLATDLERFCAGEPIAARRLSPMVRVWRRVSRRPLISGLIAAALLGIAIGGSLFVYSRLQHGHALHERKVVEALHELEVLFDADDWSTTSRREMDRIIVELGELDPELEPRARESLKQALAEAVEREIQRPNVRPEDIARTRTRLEELKKLDPNKADALSSEYQSHLKRWETVFDLTAPFADLDAVFHPSSVEVDGNTLVRSTGSEDIYSSVASSGRVGLEAVFDASWETADTVGLLVDAGRAHSGQPTALAISSDGKILASGDDQGTVLLWDMNSGRAIATLCQHEQPVGSLAFSGDDQTLLTTGGDVWLWDVSTRSKQEQQPAFSGPSSVAALSPDGEILAAVLGGGAIQLWDVEAAARCGTIETKTRTVTQLAFSPTSSLLAFARLDGTIILYDAAKRVGQRELGTGGEPISALTFSPDGLTLAITTGHASPGIQLWDVAAGEQRDTCFEQWHIRSLAFAADGSCLAAAGEDRKVGVYDFRTRATRVLLPGSDVRLQSIVTGVVFVPNTDALVTACESGAVVHWNLTTMKAVRVLGSRGYRFILHAQLRGDASDDDRSTSSHVSFSDLRSIDAPFTVEILRDQTILLREVVSPSLLPSGPLRLRATKISDGLRFELGQATSVEFRDPFVYRADTPGVFAVDWPVEARLSRLHATRQAWPEKPSPLEEGSSLYAQGRFEEALAVYQRLGEELHEVETSQQVKYGIVECLLALNRDSEAENVLKELAGESGERWPVLAACRLWLQCLRRNRFDEAEALHEDLSARVRLGEVHDIAMLVPAGLRREIINSYARQSRGLNLYKPNPKLIRMCELAASAVEMLETEPSSDEWAELQMRLVRAHRAKGNEQEAMQIAQTLVDEADPGELAYVVMEYSWMLRLAGQSKQALAVLDHWISRRPDEASPKTSVCLERARVLAALKRWEEAESELKVFFDTVTPDTIVWRSMRWEYTSACALRGFIRDQRGDTDGAHEAWKQGLQADWTYSRFGFRCLEGLILASLTGELSESDSQAFLDEVLKSLAGDSPMFVMVGEISGSLVQPKTLTPVLRNSFRSSRGREYARKIIFREITFAECIRVPPMLILCEYLRQGAMSGKLTDEQDALLWLLSDRAFTAWIETGAIDAQRILRLGLAWKGMTVAWNWVASGLDPELRGPTAYVMGHRYMRLKRPDDAAVFFQTAVHDAPRGSSLQSLAQAELDRLGPAPEESSEEKK